MHTYICASTCVCICTCEYMCIYIYTVCVLLMGPELSVVGEKLNLCVSKRTGSGGPVQKASPCVRLWRYKLKINASAIKAWSTMLLQVWPGVVSVGQQALPHRQSATATELAHGMCGACTKQGKWPMCCRRW